MRKGNIPEEMKRRFARLLRECAWMRPGLKLGVAVSGGADSVALLTLLAGVRAELGIVLSVVHFNHRLRGKDSEADEKFVTALAETFGVTLHVGRGDVAGKAKREKANLEEAARRSRYAFFEKLAQQQLVEAVATAHTMDDQAETVLAHILRGTGIAGLAAIHRTAGCVRRPLLDFRREELRKFLRAKKQRWREDATNRDTLRTRARMRKKLLPLLVREFNPAAIEHLAALADRARAQSEFVENLAEQLLAQLVERREKGLSISFSRLRQPLAEVPPESAAALRNALIEKIVAQSKSLRGQLSASHVEAIVRLAQTGETGKRLQLPGGVEVLREREALVFRARR